MRRSSALLVACVSLAGCNETIPSLSGSGGPDEPPAATAPDEDGLQNSGETGIPVDSATAETTRIAALRLVTDSGRVFDMAGSALDEGPGLTSVTGHSAYWFAWSIFHPGSEIWGVDTPVAGEPISAEGECTVPCDEIGFGCAGRDCIPSIETPTMLPADDEQLDFLQPNSLMIGVLTPEGPRAYSHDVLWRHEIVNESVGSMHYAVTLCPLTGSAIYFDRSKFVDGEVVEVGVSGSLYNSNLVMYDRTTESLWSQMRLESVAGARVGAPSPVGAVLEMTWAAWKQLYPDSLVLARTRTTVYPYGAFRTSHEDTFRSTNPSPDPQFPGKTMTFGAFVGTAKRAYVWPQLERLTGLRRGVVQDELDGVPIAVVFDLDSAYVHAFRRQIDGQEVQLTLEDAAD